jgi:hypothetical protein
VPADAVREALADEWVDAAVGHGDEQTWRELAALADGS